MALENGKERGAERNRDRRIATAFEAGAYASAYQGLPYRTQLARLESPRFDAAYRAAFTLGFWAAYERDEIRDVAGAAALAAYDAALASWAGQRCVALGFVDRCFIGPADVAEVEP